MIACVAKKEMNAMTTQTFAPYSNNASLTAQNTAPGLLARLAGLADWIVSFPRRQAVMAELAELSDHELSDIGLVRSDLGRVFDANFAASRARSQIGRTASV